MRDLVRESHVTLAMSSNIFGSIESRAKILVYFFRFLGSITSNTHKPTLKTSVEQEEHLKY